MKLPGSLWQHCTIVTLFSMLIFCSYEGMSQTRTADSLKALLPEKTGIERIDLLYELAYELVDVDNDAALTFSRIAFCETSCEDSLRLVKTGRLKALALRRQNFLDSSLDLSLQVLPIAKKLSLDSDMKSLLNGLGNIYTEQARYDKALEYYWESVELVKCYDDKFDLSVAMNNIGIVYYKLFDYENALIYFNKAIELRRQTTRKYDFANLLINAGIANANLYNYEKASSLVSEARSFCGNDCSQETLMQASFTSAFIAFYNDNCSTAEKLFLESFGLAVDIGDERFQFDNIVHLANIYIIQGHYELAEDYLKIADEKIRVAGTSYAREFKEIYVHLASVYEKLQNHKKLSYYQKRYIDLSESIHNEELASGLMRIQAQHMEREHGIKLKAQNELLAMNEQVLLRQKYLNFAIAAVALLLFTIAVILVKINNKTKKLNRLLDLKVKERTQALEIKQTMLQHACEERDVILDRIISEIKNALATVKGLGSLARKDTSEISRYLDHVDNTSEKFLQIVENLNQPKRVS